jgi:hypothetical protein
MYLEMSVTSSNVDVTSAISSDVDLTSPISSDVGLTTLMWKRLNVYWVFVTTVLARKFHKNFSEFPLKRCGSFFLFFALKKSLSGTETVARRVSSRCVNRGSGFI